MQEEIKELREQLNKFQQSNINVGSSPGAGSGVGISASNPSPTPEPSPPRQVPISMAPPADEVVQPIITPTDYKVINFSS